MRRLLATLTLAVTVAACGGSGNNTAPNTALAPAGSKAVDNALKNTTPFGEMVDVDTHTRFTIKSVTVSGGDSGPWLDVSVRGEAANQPGALPYTIGIVCSSSTDTGGWLAPSTVSLGQEIPASSYLEGTIALLLPDDGRYGEPIPTCTPPAVIKIEPGDNVWFAIPDATVNELNTRAAAYNATLPASSTTAP